MLFRSKLVALCADAVPAQIPFILLTADGGHADVRPGPNLGADDYLVKPVEVADLPEAIVARPERTPPPAGFNADFRFAASAGTRHRRGDAGLLFFSFLFLIYFL